MKHSNRGLKDHKCWVPQKDQALWINYIFIQFNVARLTHWENHEASDQNQTSWWMVKGRWKYKTTHKYFVWPWIFYFMCWTQQYTLKVLKQKEFMPLAYNIKGQTPITCPLPFFWYSENLVKKLNVSSHPSLNCLFFPVRKWLEYSLQEITLLNPDFSYPQAAKPALESRR